MCYTPVIWEYSQEYIQPKIDKKKLEYSASAQKQYSYNKK